MSAASRDFYRMDPGAWDYGTAELSLEQEAAYLRIINAMHKHKAGVPNIDRVLAGMFRCSTRKARSLVNALLDAGKVQIEDGLIVNQRAISDLVHRGFVTISRAESGAKGGRTRANNAAKSRENNDTAQAIGSTREEKRREENKEIPLVSPKNPVKAVSTGPRDPPPKRKRAVALPEGWVPSDKNVQDAHSQHLSNQEIAHEADQFRDYHHSRGSTFKDWDAAWRTWIRNSRKFAGGRMAGGPQASGRGQGGSIASIVARRRASGQV